MLYIYTGDGKGKTTVAIGTIVRATGAGKTCAIVFFDKNPDYCNELKILCQLNIDAHIFGQNRIYSSPLEKKEHSVTEFPPLEKGEQGGFNNSFPRRGFRFNNNEEDLRQAKNALNKAKRLVDKSDLLVLDELLNSIRLEQVALRDVLDLIDNFPKEKYLILTGRGLPKEIAERADLISEIKNIKHPFDDLKTSAVPGIDY
ncbi:cob(I)yrinic acid a,c-diamide adenosyltransferase [Candidatus Parcubacteria bacterium]|nr:cob(I)yrinic acid a,c-diamide adenosyltransferase [Patescibacteria group bacterium]MCG2693841.1 cob(I)yrinic acid a,c-diamide adenosyltransferase [Candidatus Parcubacteria bacterium]